MSGRGLKKRVKKRVKQSRAYGTANNAVRKAVNAILSLHVVEMLMVALVGGSVVILRKADKLFHTKLKRRLIDFIHQASRDQLGAIRRAQIRYLFRKKFNLKHIRMRLAGGSYWMSIPCIVEGVARSGEPKKYMGKIVNDRSALKHRYMTIMRNLGVFAESAGLKFDGHIDAEDMVEFERRSLHELKRRGISTPDVYGIHRLNEDDYMLVMEFIDGEPLSKVELTGGLVGQIFYILKTMHDAGVFHGDIKLDNFLLSNGRVVVVDCLKIDREEPWQAQDFDLICAICALAQRLSVDIILKHAREYHNDEELERAASLIGVAMNKVDMDLDSDKANEIERSLIATTNNRLTAQP